MTTSVRFVLSYDFGTVYHFHTKATKVDIAVKYVDVTTKSKPFGLGFWRFFCITIHCHGGHLGYVTWTSDGDLYHTFS